MSAIYITLDIGGTNMRVAAASRDALETIKKVPTPQDPKQAIDTLVAVAREVAAGREILKVAGGIRDRVVEGVFLGSKVLPRWEGLHIVDELSRGIGAPVRLEHDTAVVGLGEVYAGAGKGSKICAYVTVSTGVGGDRVVDGHIDRFTYNAEIGRQLINGVELEDLISGTAVRKKFSIEPKELADEGERNKLADLLAIGLLNMTVHWSPDTIVLGGSMIVGVNPIPLSRTTESLAKLITMYPEPPKVKMAELGDNGGLEGGRILAQEA